MNLSATDQSAHRPSDFDNRATPFRIAVVGCGPRGMYCLDSLARCLAQTNGSRPTTVTIFEPSRYPGAGNVYATDQPHFLRMNFAAKHIDAWRGQDSHQSDALPLVDWLALRRPGHADPEAYVPRAVVGEYLRDCFCRIAKSLSEIATVRVRRETVDEIEQVGDEWKLTTSTETFQLDEVMLTVGHEGWRPSKWSPPASHVSYIDRVFPIDRQLSRDRAMADQRVAVRGFGLTWIDAVLAMTEGRGGTFQLTNARGSYLPSGHEPLVVLPFSRTGRPMLAKPIESRMRLPTALSEVWDAGRDRLSCVATPIDRASLSRNVWGEIVNSAATALQCVNGSARTSRATLAADIEQWYTDWKDSRFDATKVVAALRQSVDVATGTTPPDFAWALGEAWRRLYPALVAQISHGGLTDDAWPEFVQLATEMERLAFGPPAENVIRTIALVDCGLIDLRFVSASKVTAVQGKLVLGDNENFQPIDLCVNAVIPSPVEWNATGPLARLAQTRKIQRINGYAGIEVDQCARPRSSSSNTIRGLAIVGRATEGCILGNDTLSRKLHPHIDNWASSVVARIIEQAPRHCTGRP